MIKNTNPQVFGYFCSLKQSFSQFGIISESSYLDSMNASANKTTGAVLRSFRKEAKLTQTQVAHELGKPQSFVSKTESGERSLQAHELIAYSRALGTSPSKIVTTLEAKLQ